MRRLLFIMMIFCGFTNVNAQLTNLIISEYAEGAGGSKKYIEIYNGTGVDVDLSNYELWKATNGGGFSTFIPLTGTLVDGTTIVIANNATDVPGADVYNTSISHNGDDAYALSWNGGSGTVFNPIDIFGDPNLDPGTGWPVAGVANGSVDKVLVRKPSVCSPNTDWAQIQGTDATSSEYIIFVDPYNRVGQNPDMGMHTASCVTTTNPTINATPTLVGGFVQFVGSPSSEMMFDVSAINLTADLVLTVSTGSYEISTTSGTGFTNSLTITPVAGEVVTTPIYVRLNGIAAENPSIGSITASSTGATDVIVDLDGQILNPDPIVFTSEDTLSGFSHFVGTPSAEQSFDVSGNFLQGDISVDVSNSVFEIALDAAGPYTSNLSIPASNMVTSDPSSNWVGYMNVFELPENGGAYQFGGPWGLPDLKTTLNTGSNSITLQPNFNTYNDNQTDGYWVNQTTLEGNKFMEANTFVEPGAGFNDQGLIFTGNVTSFTLDTAQYDAKCFIKALDPNAGYADAFGGSKTFDLPMSGSFSVSATAAELPAGLIIQYGFMVTGRNANPADELTLGSVEVEGVSVSTSVPVTPVYVRLNGPVLNYNQVGEIYVTSTLANVDTLALNGETLDYIPSSIGAITTNDANGVADSLGVYVELSGTVHCIDFDGNAGYSFTIIDDNNDGINVFNFNDVSNYVVAEGDILTVTGYIEQYNGLTEIVVDSILVTGTGPIQTPTVVTALDESTESQWVTLENLNFVTPIATFPTGSNNIDVTNGTDVFTIRVDADTDIPGSAAPQVSFSVTGVGGQFDNSSPYDGGYQLFPCSVASFVPSCTTPDNTVTLTDGTLNANATGANVMYAWIDCATNEFLVSTQDFTPTQTGEYAVIVMDGECSDTSDCQFVDLSNLENISLFNVSVTPNPFNENLNIQSTDMDIQNLEVFSMEGKIIYSNNKAFNSLNINTNNWKTGVYILKLQNINGTVRNVKVLKN